MTPEEERALLAAAAANLDAQARDAFEELLAIIRSGINARDAVEQVLSGFSADMAATIAAALSTVLPEAIGAAAVLRIAVGPVTLSAMLYAEAQAVGQVVQGVVTRHLQGFVDARQLALALFEGYNFRAPDAEPLQINRSNPRLPVYMREALLTSDPVQRDLSRAFAQIQVNGLATDGLRAAYQGVLDAIAATEAGTGSTLLDKRLQTAFYERTRYFAQRIAQTEIHRAYANRQALELMSDTDVQFVQIRRAPGKQEPCICVLFTGRDQWGLGPGVYPKAKAPLPPYHPYCRCVVAPRLDLTNRATATQDTEADVYFLRRLNPSAAARVMGSRAKLELVTDGQSAEAVFDSTQKEAFKLRRVGQVV